MAKGSTNGQMEGSMRESIISIISMAGEFFYGQMDRSTKGLGLMAKGMEKAGII